MEVYYVGVCPEINLPRPGHPPVLTLDPLPTPPPYARAAGSYCPSGQPAWSAFREPSFGHATLDFLNDTHAHWQWHRNQDIYSNVTDSYYIVKDSSCTKQQGAIPAQGRSWLGLP